MCQIFDGKNVNSRHSCILIVQRVILEQKKIFVNKIFVFIILRLRLKNNLTIDDPFCALLRKLSFSSQEHDFVIFFWFFFSFLINFESSDQTLSFFYDARFSTHLSKMHITCTYDSLIESWISVENCKCFFITLGLWAKLVLDFCGKKFGTAIKTSLHTYRRPFRRGTHFEIKTTSVKSVWELEWKMFWLFTTVTCTFVNIAFYLSRTPSSYFFNRFFF